MLAWFSPSRAENKGWRVPPCTATWERIKIPKTATFDLDNFISDCLANVKSQGAIQELVAEAVSNRRAVLDELGEPERGQIQVLFRSEELSIMNVIWAPKMTIFPHNHTVWAVIGIYGGREDNVFWRRSPQTKKVTASGARSLSSGEALSLGWDVIHSVTNPIEKLTGAIHVYGGNFFNDNRKEWDPETLEERPSDPNHIVKIFDEENRRWQTLRE